MPTIICEFNKNSIKKRYNNFEEIFKEKLEILEDMKSIYLSGTPIYKIPEDISICINLEIIYANNCGITFLPQNLELLPKLKKNIYKHK